MNGKSTTDAVFKYSKDIVDYLNDHKYVGALYLILNMLVTLAWHSLTYSWVIALI